VNVTPKSSGHPKQHLRTLAALKKGEAGKVVRVIATDRNDFKKFAAMGIFPGVAIKLIHRSPSYLFQVGRSQFAVDETLAAKIEIEVLS
jgi:Fe2+ transport system protein FeoA